jgi:hypothetical protein
MSEMNLDHPFPLSPNPSPAPERGEQGEPLARLG